MAVEVPGMRLQAPVHHREPDDLSSGDALIRDRRVAPTVDGVGVRRPTSQGLRAFVDGLLARATGP